MKNPHRYIGKPSEIWAVRLSVDNIAECEQFVGKGYLGGSVSGTFERLFDGDLKNADERHWLIIPTNTGLAKCCVGDFIVRKNDCIYPVKGSNFFDCYTLDTPPNTGYIEACKQIKGE